MFYAPGRLLFFSGIILVGVKIFFSRSIRTRLSPWFFDSAATWLLMLLLESPTKVNGRFCDQESCESGAVLFELLLIFPLLFALILASFEYGRALELQQASSFLAREAAFYAFRECAPYNNSPNSQWNDMDTCLQFITQRIEAIGDQYTGGRNVNVVLSVYERRAGTTSMIAKYPAGAGPVGFDTKVDAIIPFDAQVTEILDEQPKVVIAEVNLIYQPVFTRAVGILDFAQIDFYELAMF